MAITKRLVIEYAIAVSSADGTLTSALAEKLRNGDVATIRGVLEQQYKKLSDAREQFAKSRAESVKEVLDKLSEIIHET